MPQASTSPKLKTPPVGIQPRINFSDTTDELLISNLIEHQNHSWQNFVNHRLGELLQTLNPIEKEIKKNDVDYKISLSFKTRIWRSANWRPRGFVEKHDLWGSFEGWRGAEGQRSTKDGWHRLLRRIPLDDWSGDFYY